MMGFVEGFLDVLTNKIVLYFIITMVICQLIKLFTKSKEHGRVYWRGLVENGGMPSSHTTAVVSLSMSIGVVEGFNTSVFFVAALFAVIVMRDAFGVRHNVDTLTAKMNQVIKSEKLKIREADMISGHTPLQVAGGLVLAIVCVLVLHFVIL